MSFGSAGTRSSWRGCAICWSRRPCNEPCALVQTRESLPRAVSAQLPAWLDKHPHLLVRFAERASALVPLVREGVLFGAHGGLFEVSAEGISAGPRPRTMAAYLRDATDEVRDCVRGNTAP